MLGLVLIALAAASAPRDQYRIRDLHWVRAREHAVQPVELKTYQGTYRLRVVVEQSSVARLCCPQGVEPRRYILGSAVLVEGSFSKPVTKKQVGDRTLWFFAAHPLDQGKWAFTGNDCDLDVRLERWRGRGLDRLAWSTDQPGAYTLQHQLLREAEERWLRRDAADPLRHEVLRPLATIAEARLLRPASPVQEVSVVGRDGEEDEGFVGEKPLWKIEGPARIDVVARPLDEQRSICLVVDGTRSCRSSWPERTLPWRPGQGFEIATIAGRTSGSARIWHVAVGSGSHTVQIDTPAWVRLVHHDTPLAEKLAHPLVYPDDCDSHLCAEQPRSMLIAPAPTGPPAPTTSLWRSGTSSSGFQWESLLKAQQRPSSAWLDEQRILHLRVEAPAAPCELRFATGQAFVAPAAIERGRFIFIGQDDPVLPQALGCTVLVRVAPTPVSVTGLVRSVFQILRPGLTLPYLTDSDGEASLRVSVAASELASQVTVENNLGTEVFTLLPVADARPWSDSRGHAWTAVMRLALGPVQWARVSASHTVAVQLHHRPAPGKPGGMDLGPVTDGQARDESFGVELTSKVPRHPAADWHLSPQQALTTLSKAIATASEPGKRRAAYCARAATLDAIGAQALAAVDRRLAAVLDDTPCMDQPATTPLPPILDPGGWLAMDGRWLPKAEATPRALLAATRGDLVTLASAHAARPTQPDAGSPAAWLQLERWRRGILEGQILTPEQGVRAYVDLVRLGSQEMRDSLTYHPLKRASRWQPVQGFAGECDSRLASVIAGDDDDEDSLAGTLYPDTWPHEEVVTFARRALLLPPAHHNQAQVWARCRATSPRMLHAPITLSVVDAHQQPVAQVHLPPFGEAKPVSLPSGGNVYLAISPKSGAACQIRLPSVTVAALRGRDQQRGFRIRAGGRAHVEVLAPTVLRLSVTRPVLPDEVKVEIETLDSRGKTPGRVHLIDGGLQIPVTGVGPRRVWIQPTAELSFVAAIRVPRDSPFESQGDRLLLATIGESHEYVPTAPPAVDGFFGGREDNTRAATLIAYVHAGSDDTLEEDDVPTTVRFREGFGLAQRLESLPLWWDAELQLREHSDSPLVTVGRTGLDGWFLREPLDLRLVIDADVAYADEDTSARLRGYLQVGTVSLRSWVGFVRIHGMMQEWWPRQLFDPYADDPLLWSRYRDDHRRSVGFDPVLRWNASPWHRVTASAALRTNDSRDDELLDYVGLRVTSDHGGPGWQVRAAAALERRFVDNDRSRAYWSPELSGRAMYTWWPTGRLAIQVRAQLGYRAHFQRIVGGLMVRAFLSDDHGLSDVRPSHIVHRAAAEWSQDASMERDWPR